MTKYHYRFVIIYQTKYMKNASDLLDKLDLGMDEIGLQETFEMTCTNDVPIPTIKEHLRKAFESVECIILDIKGGKIE